MKKNATWANNLIVDRNFNWYYNTEIHKNKKEQFWSKKSLNEINLYFDALFSGIRVFSMKFIKRNETNGVLFLAKMVHSLVPLVRK